MKKTIEEVEEKRLERSDDECLEGVTPIKGYEFNDMINFSRIISSFKSTGMQSTNVYKAIDIINEVLKIRFRDGTNKKENIRIFLGFTSNMISCGVREIIRFLVRRQFVDAIVTTTGMKNSLFYSPKPKFPHPGAIEEDFMKVLADTYLGNFTLDGASLRSNGINRIGNLLVPNDNYIKFEDFMYDVLDGCLHEQKFGGDVVWTPSKLIQRMGECIRSRKSVYYWASKHHIPVFCPCITDGSVGDMLYMHSFPNPGLVVDLVGDVRKLNDMAVNAQKTAMIIIGGAMPKYHICNANQKRKGADYAVFINTGESWDGSTSGCEVKTDWEQHRIKKKGRMVKVSSEATIVFPYIVAKTFGHYHEKYFIKKKKRSICGIQY